MVNPWRAWRIFMCVSWNSGTQLVLNVCLMIDWMSEWVGEWVNDTLSLAALLKADKQEHQVWNVGLWTSNPGWLPGCPASLPQWFGLVNTAEETFPSWTVLPLLPGFPAVLDKAFPSKQWERRSSNIKKREGLEAWELSGFQYTNKLFLDFPWGSVLGGSWLLPWSHYSR